MLRPFTLRAARFGLVAAVVAAAARKVGDFDLPWHMAVGRAAVASRGLVRTDDFSYTFRGVATPQEYLADLLLYLAHRLGGAIGLQLLGLVLLALLTALIAARAARSPAPDLAPDTAAQRALPAIAATALALAAAAPWLVVRPALFSPVALAAQLALIDHRRRTGDLRRFSYSILIQFLWANLHGFAAVGALLLVGYGAYCALCRVANGKLEGLLPANDGSALGPTLAVVAAAVGATLLTSHGLAIFAGPFVANRHRGLVTEWIPTTLDFALTEDPMFALLALLALVALLVRGERRPTLYELGLAAGTFALALSAVRLIPLFAVAAAPLVARRLAPYAARARTAPLLLLLCAFAPIPSMLGSRVFHPGVGWDERALPIGAVRFLERERPEGPPWNRVGFGGYLVWRLHPTVRVFIDGRTGWVYPYDFIVDFKRANDNPRAFEQARARWGFEWALVGAGEEEHSGFGVAADPAWALVYLDDTAAVYVRRAGPNAALAARGYRALRHTMTTADLAHLPPADLAHDLALAREQGPGSRWATGTSPAARAARSSTGSD